MLVAPAGFADSVAESVDSVEPAELAPGSADSADSAGFVDSVGSAGLASGAVAVAAACDIAISWMILTSKTQPISAWLLDVLMIQEGYFQYETKVLSIHVPI